MILETERLKIEEFTLNDAPFIYELMNDPDWIHFIGDRNIKTLQDAKNYLANKLIPSYKNWGFGFYKVSLKNGITVGTAGLVDRDDLEHVDIGYAFLPIGRGKGYAYEASKTILEYAKNELKLNPILAIVNKDNEKSQNLLRKLGLRFEKMILLSGETEEICQFTNEI